MTKIHKDEIHLILTATLALALATCANLLSGCAVETEPPTDTVVDLPETAFPESDVVVNETPVEDEGSEETPEEMPEEPEEVPPCDYPSPPDEPEPVCELRADEAVLADRPWVSHASLPTSTLVDGTVTHARIVVTAPAANDVGLTQLTFHVRHSGFSVNLSANLRVVGDGSHLPRTETTRCLDLPCDEYVVTVTLDEDLWVPAGTSVALDLFSTVWGTESGDWMETSFVTDGELVSACEPEFHDGRLSLDGAVPNLIWTDTYGVYHSGAGITPFGPMVLAAP